MTLYRLNILAQEFSELSEREQLFLLRFAHVHNDLRHIRQLVVVANNGLKILSGLERDIALHQYLFAVKLWCGALTEAVEVINSGWNGSGLAARLHSAIPSEAKDALREFIDYFNRPNPIRIIRRRFAFHYDSEPIVQERINSVPSLNFAFVTGDRSANTFYDSAEIVRINAIFRAVNAERIEVAEEELYRAMAGVHDWFMTFSHAVMIALVEKCGSESEEIVSTCIVDPATTKPIIFVDEDAIGRMLKQRGLLLAEQDK